MDNYFASNLKYLRESKGLSMKDLENILAISKSAIGAYEKGSSEPSLGVLMKIVHYFGLSLDTITFTDMQKGKLSIASESVFHYGNDELANLKKENEAFREVFREMGRGQAASADVGKSSKSKHLKS